MAYPYPGARILVFAKAPIAGQVKTRMYPVLSYQKAANLQHALINHTLMLVQRSALAPVCLYCSPDNSDPIFSSWESRGVTLCEQRGGNLGLRMQQALQDMLKNCEMVLLIGTDCPEIQQGYLDSVLRSLTQNQVVLGPAEDGGYVLIGVRKKVPEIFKDIDWGSKRVLQQTRQRLHAMQIKYCELPELWDVDRPADLVRGIVPVLLSRIG